MGTEALALRLACSEGELPGGGRGEGELVREGRTRERGARDGEEGRIGFLVRVERLTSRGDCHSGHRSNKSRVVERERVESVGRRRVEDDEGEEWRGWRILCGFELSL